MLPRFLRGVTTGRAGAIDEVTQTFLRAHYILYHHAIGEKEVDDLRRRMNDDMFIANDFGMIIRQYQTMHKSGHQYDLGLVLSDFLEVLPPVVAAAFLKATSNPDVAKNILEGKGVAILGQTEKQAAVDILPHAVEAFVLLPVEKRHEILQAMVQAGTKSKEAARRLYQRIATNINQTRSDDSAYVHIYRNLQDQKASEKLIEIRQDMAQWNKITQ